MYVSSYTYQQPLPWRPPAGARVLRLPVIYTRAPRGLGAFSWNQAAAGITSGATYGAATAQSTGSKVVGGVTAGLMTTAGILAMIPGGQIPAAFIAAAGALVAPIASMFKGCGETCTVTTDIANKVADAASQITKLYWSHPVRTISMRDAAVQSLMELYQYLIQSCNQVGGQGGSQCVADRVPGGKYDFQAQQVAPIANDAGVVPDPSPVAAGSSDLLSMFGVNPSATVAGVELKDWLLPAALLGAAAFL